MASAYVGQIVNPASLQQLDCIEDGVIVVVDGRIVAFEKTTSNLDALIDRFQVEASAVVRLKSNQWLMPGFVDTHIHGPQYANIGIGYDMPLLDWLNNYTFPLEAKFSNSQFAEKVYDSVVVNTLRFGTTTASYYATIHKDTALLLAQKAIQYGQRAFVGKVNMNRESIPELRETTEATIADTEAFIKDFPKSHLVKPVITPRFALSCDMEAMTGLAKIAAREQVNIQTHVSENAIEVEVCATLYPESSSYCGVYGDAGLLTDKTILAHGVFLTPHELEYIKKKGTSVAHCPNSNVSLQSGLCPVRMLLNAQIKVGLGTDCAGGHSISLLDSMRCALASSIAVSFNKPHLPPLTIPEVLYLATQGGATALGIGNDVGSFARGKAFDAILVDLTTLNLLDDYTLAQMVQKFVYLGDDRNIRKVFVDGQLRNECTSR